METYNLMFLGLIILDFVGPKKILSVETFKKPIVKLCLVLFSIIQRKKVSPSNKLRLVRIC